MACNFEASLSQVRLELDRLRHHKARGFKRLELAGLTELKARIAVAVFVLSGCNAAVAGRFVEIHANPKVLNSDLEREQWVKKRYTDAISETLSSILEPGTADAQHIHSTAVKFVAEFQTAGWVVSQNYDIGVAPSSVSMALASVALLNDVAPVGAHSLKPLPVAKYWAVRFRKKWQVRFGKLGTRTPMPEGVLQEKALV